MKKVVALILALGMVTVLFSGCTKEISTTNENTNSEVKEEVIEKLTLNEVTHSIFYAPQYAAISEGFFLEEGLEIELVNGGGADNVMTAVLTGAADIGLAGAEASIYVYLQGKEDAPKVFAQLTACDGSFLISRENEDFSFDNLIGKTILPGRKGGMPYMTLLYVLNQNGLIVGEDVFFNDTIEFNAMTGAFVAGEGDYVTAFEPTASSLESEGAGYIVASIGKEGGTVPYTAYFAADDVSDDVIQRFTNAIKKGQEFVMNNDSDTIAESLQPFFTETSLEEIALVVDNYKEIGAYSASPNMKEEDFNRIIDIMKNADEIDEDITINYSDIIDDRFF